MTKGASSDGLGRVCQADGGEGVFQANRTA